MHSCISYSIQSKVYTLFANQNMRLNLQHLKGRIKVCVSLQICTNELDNETVNEYASNKTYRRMFTQANAGTAQPTT